MFGAADDVQEEITTEASTFAVDEQVYREELSGVAEVPSVRMSVVS